MTTVHRPRPSLASDVASALLSNAFLVPFQGLASLAFGALVARYLGAAGYGVFAVFVAVRSSLSFSADLGTSTGLTRFYPEVVDREGRAGARRLVALQLFVTAVTTVLVLTSLFLARDRVADLLRVPAEQRFVLTYAALAFVLEEFARVPLVLLWASFKHHQANVAQCAAAVIQLALVVVAMHQGSGLSALFVVTMVAAAVRGVLLWALLSRTYGVLPESGHAPLPHLPRRFLKISVLSWLEKLSNYVYSMPFMTLVLAVYFDKAAVGIAALAGELTVRTISLVVSPTYGVTLPAFATVWAQNDRSRQKRFFESALRGNALLVLPAGVIVLVLAPTLVPLIYSDVYDAAIPLVQLLAVFYYLEYAIYPAANAAMLAGERLRRYARVKITWIAALPVLVLVTTPFGLAATVSMYGAARLLAAMALLRVAASTHALSIPGRFYISVVATCAVAVVAGIGISWYVEPDALGAVLGAASSIAIIAVGCRAGAWIGPAERALIERIPLRTVRWLAGALTAR